MGIKQTVLIIACFLMGLCILQFVVGKLSYQIETNAFIYRYDMIPKVGDTILKMDYETLESAEGQLKIDQAYDCIYSGNIAGIEFFLNQYVQFLINILGLFVYVLVSCNIGSIVSFFILLLNCSVLFIRNNDALWMRKHKIEKDKIDVKQNYLVRQLQRKSNGNEFALYDVKAWFDEIMKSNMKNSLEWTKNREKEFLGSDIKIIIVSLLRDSLLFGYVFYCIICGQFSIDGIILFLSVTSGLNGWLGAIQENYQQLCKNNIHMENLEEFKHIKTESVRNQKGCRLDELEFKEVSYRPENTEKNIIEGLSFKVKRGDRIALIGENGAGKSTIIKLICGLYTPTSGEIIINGKQADDFTKEERFNMFSVSFQDNSIFSFSIAENISCVPMGSEDRKMLKHCLEKVGLDALVGQYKDDVDTYIGTELGDGVDMSGGEMQRLFVARVLYNIKDAVILDEPTAAMDPINEAKLYKLYKEAAENRMSFFVSHRLGSTAFCNKIMYIENGKIVEMGTHNQLLALGGKYYQMYQSQSKYYVKGNGHEENVGSNSEVHKIN